MWFPWGRWEREVGYKHAERCFLEPANSWGLWNHIISVLSNNMIIDCWDKENIWFLKKGASRKIFQKRKCKWHSTGRGKRSEDFQLQEGAVLWLLWPDPTVSTGEHLHTLGQPLLPLRNKPSVQRLPNGRKNNVKEIAWLQTKLPSALSFISIILINAYLSYKVIMTVNSSVVRSLTIFHTH